MHQIRSRKAMTTDKTRRLVCEFLRNSRPTTNDMDWREKEIVYAAGEVKTSFDMIACQVVNIINFLTQLSMQCTYRIYFFHFFFAVSFKIHTGENLSWNVHTKSSLHTKTPNIWQSHGMIVSSTSTILSFCGERESQISYKKGKHVVKVIFPLAMVARWLTLTTL